MKGYSERDIFSPREIDLLEEAKELVECVPFGHAEVLDGEGPLRCHELARWVGEVLGLEIQDGTYGFVEHTWLWTSPRKTQQKDVYAMPNILDVYVPGGLPQVQLVFPSVTLICPYRYGPPRADIRESVLVALREIGKDST